MEKPVAFAQNSLVSLLFSKPRVSLNAANYSDCNKKSHLFIIAPSDTCENGSTPIINSLQEIRSRISMLSLAYNEYCQQMRPRAADTLALFRGIANVLYGLRIHFRWITERWVSRFSFEAWASRIRFEPTASDFKPAVSMRKINKQEIT